MPAWGSASSRGRRGRSHSGVSLLFKRVESLVTIEVDFGEILEGRLGEDILSLFFTRRAPVRSCEFKENEAFLGSGLFEGIVEVCAPEVGGLE